MQVSSSRKLWKCTFQCSSFTICKPERIKAASWCLRKLVYSLLSFLQPLRGRYRWGMKRSEVSLSSHSWFWDREKTKWPPGPKSKLTDVSSSPVFLLAPRNNGSILITVPLHWAKYKCGKILRVGNEGLLGDSAAFGNVSLHILTEPGTESASDTQGKVYLFLLYFFWQLSLVWPAFPCNNVDKHIAHGTREAAFQPAHSGNLYFNIYRQHHITWAMGWAGICI